MVPRVFVPVRSGLPNGAPLLDSDAVTGVSARHLHMSMLAQVGRPPGVAVPEHTPVFITTSVRLYREGLGLILARYSDLHVAGWSDNSSDTLVRLRDVKRMVLLLDVAMPESQSLARVIADSLPDVRVVALAIPENEAAVVEWAEAGITGYVLREASSDDLVTALRSAGSGELRCPPSVAAILRRRLTSLAEAQGGSGTGQLTSREREVLTLVQQGMDNKSIARTLGIEVATAKNHVHNIFAKLSVHRRSDAVARTRSKLNLL